MSNYLMEMCNINKQFNEVLVLKNVSFQVKPGEVHTLFGENGSGKSVLMRILSGVLKPDSGEIFFKGRRVEISNPTDAQRLGIKTIFQEQVLFPDLTAAENLLLSESQIGEKRAARFIRWKKVYEECADLFESLNLKIDPKRLVKYMAFWERQLLEIAKAVMSKSNLIIMDEPTGSLAEPERENLYRIIENLKLKGISIIYISHNIEEVLKISDRITVIGDGEIIATETNGDLNKDSLIKLSSRNTYKDRYPKLPVPKGRVLFKVENLSTERMESGISFQIRKGETLGIAGLVGSGRSTIAKAIFGLEKKKTGDIYLNGTKLNIRNPYDAIKAGIGFISEDRLNEGIIEEFGISQNITLPNLEEIKGNIFLKGNKEKETARRFIKKLVIKTPFAEQKTKYLSGGNQQKVVLSKWLFCGAKVFIFDEPTVGLDTGSKVEVYNIMNEIALNNSGIILISSDISELIGMSDRILCIYKGKIVAELDRSRFSTEKIFYYISGSYIEAEK